MKTPINDGGPAFPYQITGHLETLGEVVREQGTGVSVRDYFAAKCLAGACANPKYKGTPTADMAEVSYRLADLMLAARTPALPTGEKGAE